MYVAERMWVVGGVRSAGRVAGVDRLGWVAGWMHYA